MSKSNDSMQLTLDQAPSYHRLDPITSIAADLAHSASGAKAHNKTRVLDALRARPGRTAPEYAEATGLDVYEVRRRLSDLRFDGMAQRIGSASYRNSTKQHSCWWLTAEAASALTPTAS